MGRPANTFEDVWRYVDMRGQDACWPWKAACQKGYGIFSVLHENYRVVRVICHLRGDAIVPRATADGPVVLHSCDNPQCCNPANLTIGTNKENTQDMITKGRRANF